MAKRKPKARARKAAKKVRPRATGAAARRAKTRQSARTAARKRSKAKPKARLRASSAPKKRAAARKAARPKAVTRRSAAPKRAAPKRLKREAGRPKPAALSRERRQLRDDDTIPGAPSSLNYAAKASAAESGQNLYHQRAKEHTEGGHALTGGDVDADWNDAYASGEETPGGDMSTPDQDVVEEIGRALGVEYDDSEELKGADKIESRDRNRWEYDPASAEDYKDRNRRDS